MLRKVFKVNRNDFLILAAVQGAIFLAAEVIVTVTIMVARPSTAPTLQGILLPSFTMPLCLFTNLFQIPVTFDLMLRFGVTRRRALGGILGLMAVDTAFAFALALLLVQVDRLMIGAWLAARLGMRTMEAFAIPLWGVALMALASVILGFLGGAMLQFFGRKAMWVLFAVAMGFLFLVNTFHWDTLAVPPLGVAALSAALLAGCAWSVWALLHTTVRG